MATIKDSTDILQQRHHRDIKFTLKILIEVTNSLAMNECDHRVFIEKIQICLDTLRSLEIIPTNLDFSKDLIRRCHKEVITILSSWKYKLTDGDEPNISKFVNTMLSRFQEFADDQNVITHLIEAANDLKGLLETELREKGISLIFFILSEYSLSNKYQ